MAVHAPLEKIGQESTFNPEKLERTEERLFALKAAGRKYNLPVEELPALYEQVTEKLKLIDSQDNRLHALEEAVATTKAAFTAAAAKLSEARKKGARVPSRGRR